jgi:hypothetical protein
MASMKPGSGNRKAPSYQGTAKGALQFALNPKKTALQAAKKALGVRKGGKVKAKKK